MRFSPICLIAMIQSSVLCLSEAFLVQPLLTKVATNDNNNNHGCLKQGITSFPITACPTTIRASFLQMSNNEDPMFDNKNEVPSMDWLTKSLEKEDPPDFKAEEKSRIEEYEKDETIESTLPNDGISVADQLLEMQKERFVASVQPIKGLKNGILAARISTESTYDSFEPERYIVGLSKYPNDYNKTKHFVMIDIPPFSDELVCNIRAFMGPNSKLCAILISNRDAIHYDEAPAIYTTRRPDLDKWRMALKTKIIGYRFDIPRDCRRDVDQMLDGYGPFALDEKQNNVTFIESGRPVTYHKWDDEKSLEDLENEEASAEPSVDDEKYTPKAIREREKGKRILAIFTPGHTIGSVCYIFPEIGICCSGFTIPVEDNRVEQNQGTGTAGPFMDCRGYVTTSKGGLVRQMGSARDMINKYIDRFTTILPSRGDPLVIDGNAKERREELLELIDQFEEIGRIYSRLGITTPVDEDLETLEMEK